MRQTRGRDRASRHKRRATHHAIRLFCQTQSGTHERRSYLEVVVSFPCRPSQNKSEPFERFLRVFAIARACPSLTNQLVNSSDGRRPPLQKTDYAKKRSGESIGCGLQMRATQCSQLSWPLR